MARKGPSRQEAKDSPFKAACEVDRIEYTVNDEITGTINVEMEFQDVNGNALQERAAVRAYLSDDDDGSTLTATVPATSILIGTNGLLIPLVTGKVFEIVCDEDGLADVTITSTTHTWYLVIVSPTGTLRISGPIVIA